MSKEPNRNMRDTIKILKELGCTVTKKFHTGEWLIITPDGVRHLASSTRKDTPHYVVDLVKKLKRR